LSVRRLYSPTACRRTLHRRWRRSHGPVGPRRYRGPMVAAVSRAQVLGFRARAQQLDREPGTRARLADTAVLDLGVQDTGADGGAWALAAGGLTVTGRTRSALILLWTLRGAPHLYRRADLPQVLAAVAPFSSADAGKRIFDAARPLRAAGIDPLA